MTHPAEAAGIAERLTKAQRRGLCGLTETPTSVYQLKGLGGFTVLEALRRRGLAQECGDQLGRIRAPHVAYKYKLTPLGLAVAHILREQEGK